MTHYQVIMKDTDGQELGHGHTHAYLTLAALEGELRVQVSGMIYDVKIVQGEDLDDAAALSDIRAMLDMCNLWGWR